ncbi:MAG: hypothetical protein RR840_03200 [Clostridium sp.]
MIEKVSLSIDLDLLYDTESKSFIISRCDPQVKLEEEAPVEEGVVKMVRTLKASEVNYGIITLGSKSPIAEVMPLNKDIKVVYQGEEFEGHSHKTSAGRIDRLSLLVKKFKIGKTLEVEYNVKEGKLTIL